MVVGHSMGKDFSALNVSSYTLCISKQTSTPTLFLAIKLELILSIHTQLVSLNIFV
jgi:hypothetical protein